MEPNNYGLYNMAGNVREWCWDWYEPELGGGTNPKGDDSGEVRVVRGGNFGLHAGFARCAYRGPFFNDPHDERNIPRESFPEAYFFGVGFRAVIGIAEIPKQ